MNDVNIGEWNFVKSITVNSWHFCHVWYDNEWAKDIEHNEINKGECDRVMSSTVICHDIARTCDITITQQNFIREMFKL